LELTYIAVMAGLVPAIHIFTPAHDQYVDARNKRGIEHHAFGHQFK
jgi:hypothetical protein